MKIEKNKIIELSFKATENYTIPHAECKLTAKFTGPTETKTIRGFWDGENNWKIRFSPEEIGNWTYQTNSSTNDKGLEESGEFECTPYMGNNPIYKHGPLQLSQDRYSIEHADGTPFFWLADTAWNGVIRSDEENWKKYLDTRVNQRFTAIQYVTTHWRGNALDLAGEASCTEEAPFIINSNFFKRLDRKVEMINEAELIASPVAIWTLLDTDLGCVLSEEDCITLAEYVVARYDAYQVIWLLGGDGQYEKHGVDKWKHIGRAAFKNSHNRLATLHACGVSWPNEFYRDEEWFQIATYQSGHGDSENDIKWLTVGPPATEWKNKPNLPTINLEPNYEDAHGYEHDTYYTDYHVRRAVYWSLLVSPTAGVTYGHDSIWNWNFETGPSEGHGNWHDGAVPPWYEGLETDGLNSMKIMRDIFDTIDWTTLTPAQELLKEQPGDADPTQFVAVAQNKDTTVIYSPCGGTLKLNCQKQFKIINPKTGETVESQDCKNSITFPDTEQDWLAISTV